MRSRDHRGPHRRRRRGPDAGPAVGTPASCVGRRAELLRRRSSASATEAGGRPPDDRMDASRDRARIEPRGSASLRRRRPRRRWCSSAACSCQRLPVDVFPEFAPPRVEVQTACARAVRRARSRSWSRSRWRRRSTASTGSTCMRSKSVSQLSSIELIFEPGTDLLEARQLVQERVATGHADPADVGHARRYDPAAVGDQPGDEDRPVVGRPVADRDVDDRRYTIRNRLLRVPGVANVAIWGERLELLQVQADPERLQAHDVTLDEVHGRHGRRAGRRPAAVLRAAR